MEEFSHQRLLSRLGASRQKFLATLGSFDTHTNQLNEQQALLSQLDAGLTAFQGAMADIGAGKNVTSFTLSDFSRNFLPNTGGGTDHAWGAIPLVIGDAVHGGSIYGTMRATWAAGFRRSPSINSPRRWRRGSVPTRGHSPPCCLICRHSVQVRSGSSKRSRQK